MKIQLMNYNIQYIILTFIIQKANVEPVDVKQFWFLARFG